MEAGIDGATTGVKRQRGISADDDTDLHEMPDDGYSIGIAFECGASTSKHLNIMINFR
jgi:hypothetical protein